MVLQVLRCNEMSRRLRFFHEQVTGAEIPMAGATTDIGADLDELEVRGRHTLRLRYLCGGSP